MICEFERPLYGEVKNFKGKPTLYIDGSPSYPMIYALTDCPGGRWTWEEVPQWNIRNFAKLGFNLFQVDLWFDHIWCSDGTISMDLARRQIRGILDVCPGAAVFFRLHVNSPRWWNRIHPEECTRYADGSTPENEVWSGLRHLLDGDLDGYPRHSMASLKWREEASDVANEFCRQFSQTPEGDNLVGIQIAGGVFGEWHYWAFVEHEPDISAPMTAFFRQWLLDKYKSDSLLQHAWNDPDVFLTTAEVPGMKERLNTTAGIFRDPVKERRVCDYYECQHKLVADNIIHFCRLVKESWPRSIITGVFYGYYFSMFNRQAAGGHLQVEPVLNSPYIDYLSAPQSYFYRHREMGGTGQSRGLLESCRLHGKLWLDEMDQPTFMDLIRTDIPKSTMEDNIAIIRRNVAESFSRGMGLWFYDFGPTNVSGWWDHPSLLSEIGQLKNLFESYFNKEFISAADVLLVYDTDCFYYLGSNYATDPITDTVAVNMTCADVYHSGVIFDMIYLCDLELVDWKNYRTVVFANTYFLTNKQKEYIHRYVECDGRHIIWLSAPGYTDGQKLNPGYVSETTGIKLAITKCSSPPEIVVNYSGFPEVSFGIDKPVQPLFTVIDPSAEKIGYFKDTGHTAIARKKLKDSVSWFCSLPLRNPDLMRCIFRQSGAHIYCDTGDVLYSGGGILCVHTKEGGKRKLVLVEGKIVEIELSPCSTTILDNVTGEILLKGIVAN